MDNPILFYKHPKWEIITIEILYIGFILVGLKFIIQGIVEKDWFYCVFGIGIVIWAILFFRTNRLDVKGYLAVYSNKIVEKKKHCKEVFFKDVIEVKYFRLC
ncbi:hypothetical protein [Neobacillus ginsengisoli]|uniref:Uncharacterized protein n=1 Tax=Neobacillus ginsengisoli TaxID=904295 RepID=A0ABT9XX38_9BACI|nr:hypothetical protein [Neobacillus ginsengisoli]MDQ0199906.1 hypothetical protein [Neobacillus ginsengisoli]